MTVRYSTDRGFEVRLVCSLCLCYLPPIGIGSYRTWAALHGWDNVHAEWACKGCLEKKYTLEVEVN